MNDCGSPVSRGAVKARSDHIDVLMANAGGGDFGVAELSVARDSGEISVHNFWCAIDCGVQVQPDNIVAQTESSLIYGLGLALMERVTFKDGAVAQSNFMTTGVLV